METERITTALLLAAGTGSRLGPLTDEMPKCLTRVNGTEILGRLVDGLQQNGFKRLIVVVGHLEDHIRTYLDKVSGNITVEYVVSPLYRTTNNIYSLWMARKMIKESFLLIESDLIFDPELLKNMLIPDRIAVSHLLPWMNGTTISTDPSVLGRVKSINLDSHSVKNGLNDYKTVNIYSFSSRSWKQISRRLDNWITEGKVNSYYESVFAELVTEGSLDFQCVNFEKNNWYEIDTVEDLQECERFFYRKKKDHLRIPMKRDMKKAVLRLKQA